MPLPKRQPDPDDFKQINDSYGHMIGDAVLAHVAAILRVSCRAGNACSRFGGDEFVVVLPGAERKPALAVAERILANFYKTPFHSEQHPFVPLSLSIGMAIAPGDGRTWQELLAHADREIYQIKRAHDRRAMLPSTTVRSTGR